LKVVDIGLISQSLILTRVSN